MTAQIRPADRDQALLLPLSVTSHCRLDLGIYPVYSASMLHARIPLAATGSAGVGPAGKSVHARLEIVSLHAGWSIDGNPSAPAMAADSALRTALESVTGACRASVRLTMGRSAAETEISLHEAWHWPLLSSAWPMIAAYVLPNDGVVLRLLADARARGTHAPLRDAYEVLREQRRITWSPPAVTRTREGITLQILRPPWRLLNDLDRLRGQASCIDLSLLIAGELEAAGEAPLVALLLDSSGYPEHALVGAWRGGGRHFRPILRGPDVKTLIAHEGIEFVDGTHACVDRSAGFGEACAIALNALADAAEIVAIDVTALRPPHGRVTPCETAFDATVSGAVAGAEVVADEMGTCVLETLHLLHGLWAAGGPVSLQLVERSGYSLDEILLWSRAAMGRRTRRGPRARTRGFERCLADARENARSQGTTVVREQDLWWAILTSGSASLECVFKSHPAIKASLLTALAEISPPSRPESHRS